MANEPHPLDLQIGSHRPEVRCENYYPFKDCSHNMSVVVDQR
jgi:hypothetical protein